MERYYKAQQNPILKLYSFMQYKKFIKYEPSVAAEFDKCLMISPVDLSELIKYNAGIQASFIPVGVESDFLERKEEEVQEYSMYHLGAMDWFPNYDGITWFIKEVFPVIIREIPQLKLYIYGSGSEKLNIPAIYRNNIFPNGYVKDIWEEIKNKDLAIVPLRIGSGIRVKIIELMASGKVVLTTTIGMEGIDGDDQKELLVADTAEEFSEKIIKYFNKKYIKQMLSENARKLIKEKYTWENIAKRIEDEYLSIIKYK
jgi:polysaccharide biosynthesis protein PslH